MHLGVWRWPSARPAAEKMAPVRRPRGPAAQPVPPAIAEPRGQMVALPRVGGGAGDLAWGCPSVPRVEPRDQPEPHAPASPVGLSLL